MNSKPSIEDIENMLQDKIDKRDFDNKFEELQQYFEIFKKDIYNKMENYVVNNDLINMEKNMENKLSMNMNEIKNILDKKAEKESVYNSLKLKSDKNEIDTILCNKLDKADLAMIIKALGEKLNKNDFLQFIKDLENNKNISLKLSNNNTLDYNNLNIIKEMNKDVQNMKKNINERIDIINCDIERMLEKVESRFNSFNSVMNNKINNMNNITKVKKEGESCENITFLLKKKLDIDKFDSFVNKIKSNLENNYLEISKNLEELVNNKIKNIEQKYTEKLEKQNITMNNYINKNQNNLEEYQIRVQGVINKNSVENREEMNKLKTELMEKIDEKMTIDKFYNLSEETKNKNTNLNVNQISPEKKGNNNSNSYILNSNENNNNINNITNKLLSNKIEEIQNELDTNKTEFTEAMKNQSIINEILSNENKLGKWICDSGKVNNNHNIIWDTLKINTFPDNYKLDNDNSIILVKDEGFYEIMLGLFCKNNNSNNNKKPNVHILVDNQVIISNSYKNTENNNNVNQMYYNTAYTGFLKKNKNTSEKGNVNNVIGLTIIDVLLIPKNSKLSVFYNGDLGRGLFGIKRL